MDASSPGTLMSKDSYMYIVHLASNVCELIFQDKFLTFDIKSFCSGSWKLNKPMLKNIIAKGERGGGQE